VESALAFFNSFVFFKLKSLYQFGTDNIFHAAETESENKTVKVHTYSVTVPTVLYTDADGEPGYITLAIILPFLAKQFTDYMDRLYGLRYIPTDIVADLRC
jgi:hypothetical protein